jgi:ABC-2 type transport system ATP-binding protein
VTFLSTDAAAAASPVAAGAAAAAGAVPMVRAIGLGRRFGDQWAIRDLDLELAPAEVFAFLGPNGAGKTTTVRLLTALIGPSEGTATVDGIDVVADPHEVRRRIGLLTETPSLYERLTAEENLDFFGRLHELPAAVRARRIDELLELFDLTERRRDRTATFSKGMKQKLAIARALLHEPKVLFLDEPTSGLDPEAAHIVREAMGTLKRQGRTIVLASHNLDEVERLADRVGFVRGRLLRVDSPARLRAGAAEPVVTADLVAEPPPDLVARLRDRAWVSDIRVEGRRVRVRVSDPETATPDLARELVAAGAGILGLRAETASLESVYFDVMGIAAASNGAPVSNGAPASHGRVS